MARLTTLALPIEMADEIAAAAARAERSVAFLVLGALKGAVRLSGPAPAGLRRALALTTTEDDPRDLKKRLEALASEKAPGQPLDDAVALAWQARRAQILAWVDRIARLDDGVRTDELDEELRAAADPSTSEERLLELAKSPYPAVRARVAAHVAAPEEALRALAADRDRVVREALQQRGR